MFLCHKNILTLVKTCPVNWVHYKMISIIANNISSEDLSISKIKLNEVIENKGIYFILVKSLDGKENKLQQIIYQ